MAGQTIEGNFGKLIGEDLKKALNRKPKIVRKFVCYFWFVGFGSISLGFHINVKQPNIEIHLPFGFIRLGWTWTWDIPALNYDDGSWRITGYWPDR